MMRMMARLFLTLALGAILLAPFTYGQGISQLRVSIPFSFIAAGRTFPAGTYTFTRTKPGTITLAGVEDSKLNVNLPILTSLARSGAGDDPLVAFDKPGHENVLSEVWLPGREGALVHEEKGEHQHAIVRLVPNNSGSH